MTDPLIWNAAIKAAANAVAQSAWKHCGSDNYSRGMDYGAIHQNKTDYESILALAKSAPDLRAVVAGMVVPLEWVTFDKWTCWANCSLGSYHVDERFGKFRVELRFGSAVLNVVETDGTSEKDLEAAKAAAQAHRIRCILAALGLEGGE